MSLANELLCVERSVQSNNIIHLAGVELKKREREEEEEEEEEEEKN
jgi:hypothetical protein